jgi:hypothetical protein
LIHWIIMPAEKLAAYSIAARHPLVPHTARQVGRDVVASPPCSAPGQTSSGDPWWPPVRRSYRPVGISTSTYYWIFDLTLSDEEGQG